MKKQSINYAVIGLGHIAQVAVLPAFKNAKNSNLAALVSGDEEKLDVLSRRYGVKKTFNYNEFDECLNDPEIDAVYIALPNAMHREFAIRSAEAGKHVLCEKPLAVSTSAAWKIVRACEKNDVLLMTAYRLHFDPANLKAIDLIHSGAIGKPRYFTSEFGHQVKENNIRARPEEGGTPLHDLGIYCINAARYLFRAEPIEVFAMTANPTPRLPAIAQTVTAVMKFPGDRVGNFICSFASAEISNFTVIGDKGDLFVENPYEYVGEVVHHLTVEEETKTWKSHAGDQFAPELEYFSQCIVERKIPEPSGVEGAIDVEIIEAMLESIRTGRSVPLRTAIRNRRPTPQQQIRKPAHGKPRLVKVEKESA